MTSQQSDLPLLTDVIEIPDTVSVPVAQNGARAADLEAAESIMAEALVAAQINEERVIQRVLTELLRQADLIPEQRLREVLQPTLNRFVDALIQDARLELSATLREVVSQELARNRRQ